MASVTTQAVYRELNDVRHVVQCRWQLLGSSILEKQPSEDSKPLEGVHCSGLFPAVIVILCIVASESFIYKNYNFASLVSELG